MSYASFETAIQQRLAVPAITSGFNVVVWADNPTFDYSAPVMKGNLVIRFDTESTQAPASQHDSGPVIQATQLVFELRVLTRDLRSHGAGYDAMQKIWELLTGYVPPSTSRHEPLLRGFYHQNTQLVSSADSVWDFGMRYGLDCMTLKRRGG